MSARLDRLLKFVGASVIALRLRIKEESLDPDAIKQAGTNIHDDLTEAQRFSTRVAAWPLENDPAVKSNPFKLLAGSAIVSLLFYLLGVAAPIFTAIIQNGDSESLGLLRQILLDVGVSPLALTVVRFIGNAFLATSIVMVSWIAFWNVVRVWKPLPTGDATIAAELHTVGPKAIPVMVGHHLSQTNLVNIVKSLYRSAVQPEELSTTEQTEMQSETADYHTRVLEISADEKHSLNQLQSDTDPGEHLNSQPGNQGNPFSLILRAIEDTDAQISYQVIVQSLVGGDTLRAEKLDQLENEIHDAEDELRAAAVRDGDGKYLGLTIRMLGSIDSDEPTQNADVDEAFDALETAVRRFTPSGVSVKTNEYSTADQSWFDNPRPIRTSVSDVLDRFYAREYDESTQIVLPARTAAMLLAIPAMITEREPTAVDSVSEAEWVTTALPSDVRNHLTSEYDPNPTRDPDVGAGTNEESTGNDEDPSKTE